MSNNANQNKNEKMNKKPASYSNSQNTEHETTNCNPLSGENKNSLENSKEIEK